MPLTDIVSTNAMEMEFDRGVVGTLVDICEQSDVCLELVLEAGTLDGSDFVYLS